MSDEKVTGILMPDQGELVRRLDHLIKNSSMAAIVIGFLADYSNSYYTGKPIGNLFRVLEKYKDLDASEIRGLIPAFTQGFEPITQEVLDEFNRLEDVPLDDL